MGHFFLGLLGVICSFMVLKYRRALGDMIGDADWMAKIGGVFNIVIIIGVLAFFWSLAVMFNFTDMIIAPIVGIFGFN